PIDRPVLRYAIDRPKPDPDLVVVQPLYAVERPPVTITIKVGGKRILDLLCEKIPVMQWLRELLANYKTGSVLRADIRKSREGEGKV
ncbi:MAG: hypothetical protein PHN49_02610, partial [Candidatus Omnitrophica bacterium]|nr:hypothetical protein [Candidatus Omnitrophota bacterium]